MIKDRDYYRANRHLYQFPKFTLDTPQGLIEVVFAIPVEKYDAFKILEMFDAHCAKKRPPEGGQENS